MCFYGGVGGVQGFWLPADLATVVPGGELAFFVARLPFYFSLLSCPHPPDPLPGGKGGDLRLFYARGFAPCIPGAERDAALVEPAKQVPGAGGARG